MTTRRSDSSPAHLIASWGFLISRHSNPPPPQHHTHTTCVPIYNYTAAKFSFPFYFKANEPVDIITQIHAVVTAQSDFEMNTSVHCTGLQSTTSTKRPAAISPLQPPSILPPPKHTHTSPLSLYLSRV